MEYHTASAGTKNRRTQDRNVQLDWTRNRSLDLFGEHRRSGKTRERAPATRKLREVKEIFW